MFSQDIDTAAIEEIANSLSEISDLLSKLIKMEAYQCMLLKEQNRMLTALPEQEQKTMGAENKAKTFSVAEASDSKYQAIYSSIMKAASRMQIQYKDSEVPRRVRKPNKAKTAELVIEAVGNRSLRQFAVDIGCDPSVVSRIIRGEQKSISPKTLTRIVLGAKEEIRENLCKELLAAQGYNPEYKWPALGQNTGEKE